MTDVWAWEAAASLRNAVVWQSNGANETIARALLDAHQRGRREGMEEVYPLLERLRSWIEDEVYAELPFTAEEQDAFDAIRAKAQEVKT